MKYPKFCHECGHKDFLSLHVYSNNGDKISHYLLIDRLALNLKNEIYSFGKQIFCKYCNKFVYVAFSGEDKFTPINSMEITS